MKKEKSNFAFTKVNYLLLVIGVVLICVGLILMIGGGSADSNHFSDEIFNTQRLTIAPILMATGFVLEVFAIMYKPKNQ